MTGGMILALAAVVAGNAQAAPDVAVPLAPAGKWVVNYDKSACVASRSFSAGPNVSISYGVIPLTLADGTTVFVIAPKGVAKRSKATKTARIVVEPPGRSIEITSAKHGTLPDGGSGTKLVINRGALPALFAATRITIEAGDTAVSIAPTEGEDAFKALQVCETKLMTEWGVDPAVIASTATAAKLTNLSELFHADDYPPSARGKVLGSGLILVRIGTDGRVSDCRTIESGGDADVDQAICSAIARRAVFTPALDRDGNAITTWWTRHVTWPQSG